MFRIYDLTLLGKCAELFGGWNRSAALQYRWTKVAGLSVQKDSLIFQIHRVVRSIAETTGLDAVDVSSRSILNFIGEAEAEERTLNVSDIVKAPGFGTPPTVYTRLSKLEQGGWIEFKPNPQDGRAKHVRLTRNARKAYARMSEAIRKL